MRTVIISCDVCGEEPALELLFYVDRRMGPAGSMDDEFEHLDLCHKCSLEAYLIAEKSVPFTERSQVYNTLRDRGLKRKKKAA